MRRPGLFALIGFSHAEDMTIRATRGVAHHHQSSIDRPVADDTRLAKQDFAGHQRLTSGRQCRQTAHTLRIHLEQRPGQRLRGQLIG